MNCEVGSAKTSANADGLPNAPGLEGGPALAPVPPANEQTFVCLRGPCRWYWERSEPFGDGTHLQRLRFCTFGPQAVNLTDGNVFDCNRHEPRSLLGKLLGAFGL